VVAGEGNDVRGGVNSPSFRIAEITVGGRKG
jgi:hypothetical protein